MRRKIGRYEVIGDLATGGMAEILLARLVGPSGFERPVVIKRIRSDLDRTELAELFLEEARLAAKVRHPNVVHVEDLGAEDGAPYIVMEYLEGESVANVTRRLVSRRESLPYALAAHVIAEACAGLHAAHELRDVQGRLLGVVHRDVSPQNVFVTYQGAVKVLDFGIAQSGPAPLEDAEVRGKFAYMSPEQVHGKPLDRRSDVFGLGIVLYELATGRRLFKRFDNGATMRAVASEPILPLRRVDARVPEALEAICMRALARSPDDRYATAAEMRRDLLAAVRAIGGDAPSDELAALMQRCFEDRIEEKRELLRNVREGSIVEHVPSGNIDVAIEIPGVDEAPTERLDAPAWLASTTPLSATNAEPPPPPPARRRRSVALVAAPLLAAAVVAAVLLARHRLAPSVAPATAASEADAGAAVIAPLDPPAIAAEADAGAAVVAPPDPTVAAEPSSESTDDPTADLDAGEVVEPVAAPVASTRAHRARAPKPRASRPAATHATPAASAPPAPSASARGFHRFQ